MKREIKFRAWDVKNQQMIAPTESGFSIEMYLDGSFAVMQLNEDNGKWYDREGDDFELMQYTGMKDKNGKNIYELDILYDEWSHVGVVKRSENESISAFIIVWDDGDECCIFNDAAHADIVVAGNIYENPELL